MIDWRTSIGLTLGWRIGHGLHWIGSVLHQDKGGIGKSIPDAQEISRDPKDFPREILREISSAEGMDFLPSFDGVRSSSTVLKGMDQEILACIAGKD